MPRLQDRPLDNLGIQIGNIWGDKPFILGGVSFVLGEVEIELDFLEGKANLGVVKSKKEWETFISTMYKRKDRKVRPVNRPLACGPPPGGNVNGEPLSANSSANGKFKPTIAP